MLAYSIVNWIKRLALPSIYKKRLIKALRYRFFNVAARIVRHGRYIVMKLAQGIHRFTDISYAYEGILGLQFQSLNIITKFPSLHFFTSGIIAYIALIAGFGYKLVLW